MMVVAKGAGAGGQGCLGGGGQERQAVRWSVRCPPCVKGSCVGETAVWVDFFFFLFSSPPSRLDFILVFAPLSPPYFIFFFSSMRRNTNHVQHNQWQSCGGICCPTSPE